MNILIGDCKIKINNSLLFILKKYIQKNNKSIESGGILIGKENLSNNGIIIDYITEPLSEDIQRCNRFYRKDKGHIELFKTLYAANLQTIRYMGEWHTHPEAVPNYSSIDLRNWVKIGNESPCILDFYHIIVGYKALCIWKYNNKNRKTTFICSISWKDVI